MTKSPIFDICYPVTTFKLLQLIATGKLFIILLKRFKKRTVGGHLER